MPVQSIMESRMEEMDELRVKKRKSVKELSNQMDLVKCVVNYKEKPDKRQQQHDKKQNKKNELHSPKASSQKRRANSVAYLPQPSILGHESDDSEEEDKSITPTSARSKTSSYPVTVPLYERRIHSARSSRVRKFANFC